MVLANNNIYLTSIDNIDSYYQRIKYQLSAFNYGMNYLSLSGLFNINTKGNILSIDINSNIQISVTKLDLSYCSLTCETLFKFFENNPGFLELRSLNLSNNNLTDDFFSLFLKNKLNLYFQKLSHLNSSLNLSYPKEQTLRLCRPFISVSCAIPKDGRRSNLIASSMRLKPLI